MAKLARTIKFPMELQARLDQLVAAQILLHDFRVASDTASVKRRQTHLEQCLCDDLEEYVHDTKACLEECFGDVNAYLSDLKAASDTASVTPLQTNLKKSLHEVKACVKAAKILQVGMAEHLRAVKACAKEYLCDAKEARRKGCLRTARHRLREYLRAAIAYLEKYLCATKAASDAASIKSIQTSLKKCLHEAKAGPEVCLPMGSKCRAWLNAGSEQRYHVLVRRYGQRVDALKAIGMFTSEDIVIYTDWAFSQAISIGIIRLPLL